MSQMRLEDLIKALREIPADKVIRHGFGSPHSYRGSYDELAFTPAENVTAGSMLAHAESALGATFEGYKGGEYVMQDYTPCWIEEYGTGYGDGIGPALVSYWKD